MPKTPWPDITHALRNILGLAQLDAEQVASALADANDEGSAKLAGAVFDSLVVAGGLLRAADHFESGELISVDLASWALLLAAVSGRLRVEASRPVGRVNVRIDESIAAGSRLVRALGDGPALGASIEPGGSNEIVLRTASPVRSQRALDASVRALEEAGICAVVEREATELRVRLRTK